MATQCLKCGSIWSIGTEEYDSQHCSACGWSPGSPVDDEDDDFDEDFDGSGGYNAPDDDDSFDKDEREFFDNDFDSDEEDPPFQVS